MRTSKWFVAGTAVAVVAHEVKIDDMGSQAVISGSKMQTTITAPAKMGA